MPRHTSYRTAAPAWAVSPAREVALDGLCPDCCPAPSNDRSPNHPWPSAVEMSAPRSSRQIGSNDSSPDFDHIYREEAPRLARYFRRHVTGADDVPDLVQETFVRLVAAKLGVRCERPTAYLQRIARNLLIDRSRRPDMKVGFVHLDAAEPVALSVAAEQGYAIERDDTMRLYRRAVAELPARTRDAFLLHRIDGLTYKDIAVRLEISIPTVQYHIARALVRIDRVLKQG